MIMDPPSYRNDEEANDDPPPILPIRVFANEIAEAIEQHPVIVVIGETGSGKTTQISQIIEDAGLAKEGIIGITQPRRVAAVSVARRVAEERGVEVGGEVGYAVRFEDRCSSRTRIKYLTGAYTSLYSQPKKDSFVRSFVFFFFFFCIIIIIIISFTSFLFFFSRWNPAS
jgi:hypothetical protein